MILFSLDEIVAGTQVILWSVPVIPPSYHNKQCMVIIKWNLLVKKWGSQINIHVLQCI